jgi:hypothetical protein
VEHAKRPVDNRSRLERRLWARTWHSKTHSSRCWGPVTCGVENRNRDLYDLVPRKAEVRTHVSGQKNDWTTGRSLKKGDPSARRRRDRRLELHEGRYGLFIFDWQLQGELRSELRRRPRHTGLREGDRGLAKPSRRDIVKNLADQPRGQMESHRARGTSGSARVALRGSRQPRPGLRIRVPDRRVPRSS